MRGLAGQHGEVLAGEQQRRGARRVGDRLGPGHGGLEGVAGAPDLEVGDEAQAGRVLHGLVRGPVLAEADGIVGQDVDHPLLHERRHADGVAAVVAEGEERPAVGDEPAVEGHPVHDGRHPELADPVVDVPPAGLAGPHRAGAGEVGEVGAGEVGAAAEELRHPGAEERQHLLRGLAAGDGARRLHGGGQRVRAEAGEVGREGAAHAALELRREGGMGRAVGLEARLPLLLRRGAAGAGVPLGADGIRDLEGRVAPAERLAGGADLVGAERLAVGLGRAGAPGRTLADGGATDDERGGVAPLPCLREGAAHRGRVVPVHRPEHAPPVGAEALGGVVGEPAVDGAVDGDAVVVVQRDELAELPGAGQRAGLVADPLHEAAVAQEDVGAVVHDGVAGTVELIAEEPLGQGHAHGVGQPLAQRAGGGLDAGGEAVLRVARGLAVELAEALELLERQGVAAQVEQRVEQHGRVPVGEHEAVAVGPGRVGRVVAERPAPEGGGHLGHAHRGAGVAGVGRLHGVHGQGAERVRHGIGEAVGRADHPVGGGGGHQTAPRARLRRSIRRQMNGVKMSCIASSILPPGTTIVLARDMNESWIMESR